MNASASRRMSSSESPWVRSSSRCSLASNRALSTSAATGSGASGGEEGLRLSSLTAGRYPYRRSCYRDPVDVLATHAKDRPDAPALIAGDETVTFSQLNEYANRLGNALLTLGVEAGDKVCVTGYNAPEHFVVSNAVAKIAATSVPMNYRLKPAEIAYQLNNSDTVVVFAGPDRVAAVQEARGGVPGLRAAVTWDESLPDGWLRMSDLIAEASPHSPVVDDDAAGGVMLYTAGTTGQPKGALRRAAARGNVAGTERGSFFDLKPGVPHLVAGPMYHSAPLAFAGVNLLLGGPDVIMRRFDPEEALRLIEKYSIEWTFMAPTLLTRIVNLPDATKQRYDVSSISTIIVAAAPCPFELKRRVMDLFGPVLYEFYGASETGMNTLIRPDEHARKPGSCGRVVPGQEVRILDDDGNECETGMPGEIWVKAPGMIDEYYKDPEKTAEAKRGGFFSVGDVGYFDDDGYLYICDRKRDMIISGGANIYCAEIENVIHAHPGVWDVAVIGIPNEEWGEQVHAIVQPKPGEVLRAQDVIAWVGEHLADYKKPRSVEFREDFPRDEAGKIRKRDLREPYWVGRETRV